MNYEQEIKDIKLRNEHVELDKQWETSKTRTGLLILVTYILVVVFLIVIKNERPFINALVPALGYFLSTQSLSFAKRIWVKKICKE